MTIDPKAVLDWLKQVLNPAIQREAIQRVLANGAEISPQTANEYISILPAGQNRNDLMGQLAGRWAQSDLDDAVAWVKQLPEGPGRNAALSRPNHDSASGR